MILCADESPQRLAGISSLIKDVRLPLLLADTAADCISLCVEYKPSVVFIDQDLLEVDQWSIPEQVHIISPTSQIVLLVEEVERWQHVPSYVDAIAKRLDPAEIISLLHGSVSQ